MSFNQIDFHTQTTLDEVHAPFTGATGEQRHGNTINLTGTRVFFFHFSTRVSPNNPKSRAQTPSVSWD